MIEGADLGVVEFLTAVSAAASAIATASRLIMTRFFSASH